MQIALLTYSTKPRGSVIHTLELAEALHELGHSVCIYALDKDGQGFERSVSCEVKQVPAKPVLGDLDQLIQQRIKEFIQFLSQDFLSQDSRQYEIFHAQDCIAANALAILRQRGLIPNFVRTVHHIEDYSSPYLQQCQEQSIRQPDLCFCVSDYWQQQLWQHYQIRALRVLNGVNSQRFTAQLSGQEAALKARFGICGAPVFLTVGGIEPRKNTIQLLKAFAKVRSIQPQAQLVIAGGATLFDYQTYRDEFFQQAAQLNISVGDALLLPGVVADADLPALYRCATAFVFPSTREGWGLVVLEAIASGLPTIVSEAQPFIEFLTARQTLFIQPDHPDSIAEAMLISIQSNFAQSLVQNSQTVIQNYSWSSSAKMHVQHYLSLLSRRA